MKVAVIGAGRWGCTLAELLNVKNDVTIFCTDNDYSRFLTDKTIPKAEEFSLSEAIILSCSREELSSYDFVFLAVPGKHLKTAWQHWGKFISGIVIVSTKTISHEGKKLLLPVPDLINYPRSAYFSSAAFPETILNGYPTMGTVYSNSKKVCEAVKNILPDNPIQILTSQNIAGGQIGAALKNVVAIVVGCAYELGMDKMTLASIINRGAEEIAKFAIKNGCDANACGIGTDFISDLIGTCFSEHSHHHETGMMLAKGKMPQKELEEMIGTIEGFETIRVLRELDVLDKMPVANACLKLISGTNPKKTIEGIFK